MPPADDATVLAAVAEHNLTAATGLRCVMHNSEGVCAAVAVQQRQEVPCDRLASLKRKNQAYACTRRDYSRCRVRLLTAPAAAAGLPLQVRKNFTLDEVTRVGHVAARRLVKTGGKEEAG